MKTVRRQFRAVFIFFVARYSFPQDDCLGAERIRAWLLAGNLACREVTMPRYHFDLVGGLTIADEGGAELCDDIIDMDAAEDIARRLVRDRPELKNRHYMILVSDEDDREICRIPLDVIH